MTDQTCGCTSADGPPLGGVAAKDFGTLDALALKLACLDEAFAAPMREIGRVIGGRIAAEQQRAPVDLEAALSALIPACGLADVVSLEYLERTADHARLRVSGCSEALGWPVPQVRRRVCGFDAGLFEGFLSATTGRACTVEETACLGLGNPACEFAIGYGPVSDRG